MSHVVNINIPFLFNLRYHLLFFIIKPEQRTYHVFAKRGDNTCAVTPVEPPFFNEILYRIGMQVQHLDASFGFFLHGFSRNLFIHSEDSFL